MAEFMGRLDGKEFHRHNSVPDWSDVEPGCVWRCDCGDWFVRTAAILDAPGVDHWRNARHHERKQLLRQRPKFLVGDMVSTLTEYGVIAE